MKTQQGNGFDWAISKKNNRATGVGVTAFGYPHRRRQVLEVLWASSASGTDFPAAPVLRAVGNELVHRMVSFGKVME